jgi:ribosomal protein S18 acetylase RimI-like enzyme
VGLLVGSGLGAGTARLCRRGTRTCPRRRVVWPRSEEPGVGHVARIYVDPACWGRGIGTQLYVAALRDLTGRNFPEATLWVLEANRRARSWYESLGWRLSDKRTTTYAPAGIDDVQYRLTLTNEALL